MVASGEKKHEEEEEGPVPGTRGGDEVDAAAPAPAADPAPTSAAAASAPATAPAPARGVSPLCLKKRSWSRGGRGVVATRAASNPANFPRFSNAFRTGAATQLARAACVTSTQGFSTSVFFFLIMTLKKKKKKNAMIHFIW